MAGPPDRGRSLPPDEAAASDPSDVDEEAPSPGASTPFGHAGEVARESLETVAAREMERLMEGAVTAPPPPTRAYGSPDAATPPVLHVVDRAGEADDAESTGDVPRERARVDSRAAAPISSTSPAAGNRMLTAVVAAGLVVGVAWMVLRDPPPPRTPSTIATPPPAAPIPPRGGEPKPERPAPQGADPAPIPAAHADDAGAIEPMEGSTGEGTGEAPPDPTDEPAAGIDPREPPPGTPEAIADEFRKLPVSAADRPPVGGVGAGGIHVDRIWMGAEYVDGDCQGKSDAFSVTADPRPSVCLRVVHPREKEDVAVVWERKGGAARRGKISIKPIHAYRTRAYLLLRKEYVGDWTVRILSQDGVELAAHDFEVVD